MKRRVTTADGTKRVNIEERWTYVGPVHNSFGASFNCWRSGKHRWRDDHYIFIHHAHGPDVTHIAQTLDRLDDHIQKQITKLEQPQRERL